MTRTLSALCLCALLVGCVPPKPSAEMLEYAAGDPPYATVLVDQVSGELFVTAELSTPSICDGDSTNLQVRLQVAGPPQTIEYEGTQWLGVREAHLNGTVEVVLVRQGEDATLDLLLMVHLPDIPCTETTVTARYVLEQR